MILVVCSEVEPLGGQNRTFAGNTEPNAQSVLEMPEHMPSQTS